MRYLFAVLVALAACGGGTEVSCTAPIDACPGSVSAQVVYLCNGSPCPVGLSTAEKYFVCVCSSGAVLTFKAPVTQTDCTSAIDTWVADCH